MIFFGSNESAIEALEKLQKMDAEQFQKLFSALKELQEGQQSKLIGFCIYQGIKSEREKQKSLSDTSNTEVNNLDKSSTPGTKLYVDVSSPENYRKIH